MGGIIFKLLLLQLINRVSWLVELRDWISLSVFRMKIVQLLLWHVSLLLSGTACLAGILINSEFLLAIRKLCKGRLSASCRLNLILFIIKNAIWSVIPILSKNRILSYHLKRFINERCVALHRMSSEFVRWNLFSLVFFLIRCRCEHVWRSFAPQCSLTRRMRELRCYWWSICVRICRLTSHIHDWFRHKFWVTILFSFVCFGIIAINQPIVFYKMKIELEFK